MAVNMGTAVAYLELDTSKFSKGFVSAYNDLKVFGDKSATAGKKVQGLSSAFRTVGSSLTKTVTTPLVGIGAAAIKATADFDEGMSEVKAISGATGTQFQALRDKAIEMGAKTKFSATEASHAFKYMAMAGWDSAQMMDGIEGVMNLAAASGEDLATTSDIVTDALTAFGLQAKDSAHFADILAQASARSNTNVGMMGETFKYVAPVAGAMGYSAEDTAVAIGLMANSGIKASQAGTALRSVISRMASPTKQVSEAMEQYKISLTDTNGKMKPLQQLMVELRGKTKDLSKEQKVQVASTIAGKNAMSGMLAILNASDKDFNKLTKDIANSDGAAEKMAKTMLDNLKGSLTLLKSALESAGIVIGDRLVPYIQQLTKWITKLVEKFNGLSEKQKDQIVRFGLIAAAIGPVMLVLSKLMTTVLKVHKAFTMLSTGFKTVMTSISLVRSGYAGLAMQMGGIPKVIATISSAFGAISLPVVAVVAVIGTLIGVFATLWKTNDKFRSTMIGIFRDMYAAFVNFIHEIKERMPDIGVDFSDIVDGIKQAWMGLCDILAPVFEGAFRTISIVFQSILNNIIGVLDIFIGLFTGNFSQVAKGIGEIISNIVKTFSKLGENILSTIGDVGSEILKKLGLDKAAKGFKKFFDTLGTMVGNIPKLLSGAIDTIVTFFTQTIPNAFDGAIKAISNFVDGVVKFFTVTVPETFNTFVTQTIPNAINSIVKWFSQLPYKIGFAIGQLIGYFYKFGSNVISWATTQLPKIIANIINWFKQLPSKIWNCLTTVVSNVIKWGSNMAKNGMIAGKNFVSNVVTFIKSLPDKVHLLIVKVLRRVVAWAIDLRIEAKQAATGFVNNFTSFIKSLPDKVWNLIKGVINKVKQLKNGMKQAGKDAIDALLSGLKSAAKGVVNFVKGFVRNVKNLIKGIKDGFEGVVKGAGSAKKAAESVDGKHANGLDYVPYNGYIAELHKGERVLTAAENKKYNKGQTNTGGDTYNFYNTKPNPYEYARQMKKAKRDLAYNF